jgi:hypothetical protein
MTRPECYILKDAAILAKRDLALGTAVQIIKNSFRHSATRQGPEILDTNDPGGCDLAGRSGSHFGAARESGKTDVVSTGFRLVGRFMF